MRQLRSQWLATALFIPLILLGAGWYFSTRSAHEASIQTFNVERVTEFQNTGEVVDRKVSAFFTATANGRATDAARDAALESLIDHATKTESLRGVLEPSASRQYMHTLGELREAIEQTRGPTTAGYNTTLLGRVIVERRALADEALRRLS